MSKNLDDSVLKKEEKTGTGFDDSVLRNKQDEASRTSPLPPVLSEQYEGRNLDPDKD